MTCQAVVRRVGVAEAEHPDRAGGVLPRVVALLPGAAEVDPPAAEDHRGVADHLLGVARRPADGVQLEQLAAVVLVGRVADRAEVVEVGEHRRVQRARDEQVLEPAERVLPHGLVVADPVDPRRTADGADVEVVGPEVDHRLEHLAVAVDPPQHRPRRQLVGVAVAHLALGELHRRGLPQLGEPPVEVADLGVLGHGRGVELPDEPGGRAAERLHLREGRLRPAAAEPVHQVEGVRRGHLGGAVRVDDVPPAAARPDSAHRLTDRHERLPRGLRPTSHGVGGPAPAG